MSALFIVVILIVAVVAKNFSALTTTIKPNHFNANQLAEIRKLVQSDSSLPKFVKKYLTAENIDRLANYGMNAYFSQSSGASSTVRFEQAGGQVLISIKGLEPFIRAGHWRAIAEVPPGKSPRPRGPNTQFQASITIPAGFHFVIKETGRLYFECTAKTIAECFPADVLGKQ